MRLFSQGARGGPGPVGILLGSAPPGPFGARAPGQIVPPVPPLHATACFYCLYCLVCLRLVSVSPCLPCPPCLYFFLLVCLVISLLIALPYLPSHFFLSEKMSSCVFLIQSMTALKWYLLLKHVSDHHLLRPSFSKIRLM